MLILASNTMLLIDVTQKNAAIFNVMIIKIENGWSGDITFSFSIVGAMIQNRLQWL